MMSKHYRSSWSPSPHQLNCTGRTRCGGERNKKDLDQLPLRSDNEISSKTLRPFHSVAMGLSRCFLYGFLPVHSSCSYCNQRTAPLEFFIMGKAIWLPSPLLASLGQIRYQGKRFKSDRSDWGPRTHHSARRVVTSPRRRTDLIQVLSFSFFPTLFLGQTASSGRRKDGCASWAIRPDLASPIPWMVYWAIRPGTGSPKAFSPIGASFRLISPKMTFVGWSSRQGTEFELIR